MVNITRVIKENLMIFFLLQEELFSFTTLIGILDDVVPEDKIDGTCISDSETDDASSFIIFDLFKKLNTFLYVVNKRKNNFN